MDINEHLESIGGVIPDGIVIVNRDGRIVYSNASARRILGMSQEQIESRTAFDKAWKLRTIGGSPVPNAEILFNIVIEQGKPAYNVEHSLERPDGSRITLSVNVGPLRDESGSVTGIIAALTDVTRSKRAEEYLRESEEKYRMLVEAFPHGVCILQDGKVAFANPAALEMYGFKSPEEFIGKNDMEPVAEQDRKRLQGYLRARLEGKPGVPDHYDAMMKRKDGSVFPAEVLVNLIKYRGRPARQVIVMDVSSRRRSEQELARIRKAVEATSDAIAIVDVKGRSVYYNPSFVQTFGYNEAEFMGGGGPFAVYEDPALARSIYEVIRQGGKWSGEAMMRTWEGRTFPAFVRADAITDEEGRIIGYIGIGTDITEIKQTEAALLRSQREKDTIMSSVTEHLIFYDDQMRIIWANRAAAESVNTTPEQLTGRLCHEVWHGRSDPCPDCPVSRARQSGQAEESEVTTPDGRAWFIKGYPVRDENGQLQGLVEVTLEITDRKRAERALAEEKERLAVTLRSIGDGVITTDVRGRVVLLNKVAENLTGWRQDEAAGRPLAEVFHIIDEKSRKPMPDPAKRIVSEGAVIEISENTVLVAKDGKEHVIADSGAPIRDKESRIVGAVLVFRDITEKRRIEQELAKAEKIESLGILAGGIAHDFNNILTAILGNISFAKTFMDGADRAFARLSEAEKACVRARGLTQQLLTFSRGGAPVRAPSSMTELIRETAGFALGGSNVECVFHFDQDLWPADVDQGQISQVINNLVINADQAMPAGGTITISGENHVVDDEPGRAFLPLPPGRYVKIAIADQGTGIPQQQLGRIFDPFFSTKQRGTGLGLAVTYSIIKKHDGHIEVESEPGQGTTISIFLPASDAVPDEKKKEAATPEPVKGKILLMDDEDAVRELVAAALHEMGFTIETAEDGAKAIKIYQQAMAAGEPFDVVILDLTVRGGMGGRQTIKSLLKIDPKVRAIVTSGYSTDPVMAEYREYGFKGVLTKPFRPRDLARVISQVMAGSET